MLFSKKYIIIIVIICIIIICIINQLILFGTSKKIMKYILQLFIIKMGHVHPSGKKNVYKMTEATPQTLSPLIIWKQPPGRNERLTAPLIKPIQRARVKHKTQHNGDHSSYEPVLEENIFRNDMWICHTPRNLKLIGMSCDSKYFSSKSWVQLNMQKIILAWTLYKIQSPTPHRRWFWGINPNLN